MAGAHQAISEPSPDTVASMARFLDENPDQLELPPSDPNKVAQATQPPPAPAAPRASGVPDEEQAAAEQAAAGEEARKRLAAQDDPDQAAGDPDATAEGGDQQSGADEPDVIETLADLATLFPDGEDVTEDSLLDLQIGGRDEGEQVSLREVVDFYRHGPSEDEHVAARIETHRVEMNTAHQERIEKLERATAGFIASATAEFEGVPWAQLKAEQPDEYIRLYEKREVAKGKINDALAEMDKQTAERETADKASRDSWEQDQIAQVHKLHPEWAKDPAKSEKAMGEVQDYAKRNGFTQELFDAMDHAMALHTVWKAAQWDKVQAAKPGLRRQLRKLPRTLRATARAAETTSRDVRRQQHDQLVAAHREQGSVDTAAALLKARGF